MPGSDAGEVYEVPEEREALPPLPRKCSYKLGLVARKTVFGVAYKASLKPVSSATETS